MTPETPIAESLFAFAADDFCVQGNFAFAAFRENGSLTALRRRPQSVKSRLHSQ